MNRTIRKREDALSRLVAFEILAIGASLFCFVFAALLMIMPVLALFGVAVPIDSVTAMAHGGIASAVGSGAFFTTWIFLKKFHSKLYQEQRNDA